MIGTRRPSSRIAMLAALIAHLMASMSCCVSISSTSAPPLIRPRICGRKLSRRMSKVVWPMETSLRVGPIDPTTYLGRSGVSNLSHAFRAICAAMRFTSSARSERFASPRSSRLPLKVLVSTASQPTARKLSWISWIRSGRLRLRISQAFSQPHQSRCKSSGRCCKFAPIEPSKTTTRRRTRSRNGSRLCKRYSCPGKDSQSRTIIGHPHANEKFRACRQLADGVMTGSAASGGGFVWRKYCWWTTTPTPANRWRCSSGSFRMRWIAPSAATKPLTYLEQTLPDVVLLDVMMPGMDGMEVLRQIRSDPRTARLAVIMYSAVSDPAYREAALSKGADDYLVKGSVEVDDLRDCIERHAAVGHPPAPQQSGGNSTTSPSSQHYC